MNKQITQEERRRGLTENGIRTESTGRLKIGNGLKSSAREAH
jgi:hypothetical protein